VGDAVEVAGGVGVSLGVAVGVPVGEGVSVGVAVSVACSGAWKAAEFWLACAAIAPAARTPSTPKKHAFIAIFTASATRLMSTLVQPGWSREIPSRRGHMPNVLGVRRQPFKILLPDEPSSRGR
jgi:hypothetical protein